MKYLSDYSEQPQTELFDRLGAFFAFSDKQFDEGKKEGIKYCSLGSGTICPIGCEKELIDELDRIHHEAMAQDLSDNGRVAIIKRELSNHECYYTGDITDCVENLADYGITADEIRVVYNVERHNEEY